MQAFLILAPDETGCEIRSREISSGRFLEFPYQLSADRFNSGRRDRHFLQDSFKPDMRTELPDCETVCGVIVEIASQQGNIAAGTHLDMIITAKIMTGLITQQQGEICTRSIRFENQSAPRRVCICGITRTSGRSDEARL